MLAISIEGMGRVQGSDVQLPCLRRTGEVIEFRTKTRLLYFDKKSN